MYDIIFLGSGASALMCAAHLRAQTSWRIALIETNARSALKLKASGGGKCNVTHVEVDATHFLGDEALVRSVLDRFSQRDLLKYLAQRGLQTTIRKGKYHFCPRSSEEVIEILMREARGCTWFYAHRIEALRGEGPYEVHTSQGVIRAHRVVIATGGASYRSLGASDIGLQIARAYGIGYRPFEPALVGLTVQKDQFWMKELSGISFLARIRVGEKVLEEDLLFTHRGISGPVVLSASLYWRRGSIAIDFCPECDWSKLMRHKSLISHALPLPRRFVQLFLGAIGLEDRPMYRLSDRELGILRQQLHEYSFAPAGNFGMDKAEVSKGGIMSEALDHRTLALYHHVGMYAIGEVVDVTGELGGYNLQWAFSSAVVCAHALIEESRRKR